MGLGLTCMGRLAEDIRWPSSIVTAGKTTLVDAMLKQAKVFRDNQAVEVRRVARNGKALFPLRMLPVQPL